MFPGKPGAKITIDRAVYGVLDDPKRTRDVRRQVQKLVDHGADDFQVASLAVEGDPAFGIVKTLVVNYTVDGKHLTATGTDPENIVLTLFAASNRVAELARTRRPVAARCVAAGAVCLKLAGGRTRQAAIAELPPPLELAGPWDVSFPPESGLKQPLRFDRLVSWTERPELGVKYFQRHGGLSGRFPGFGRGAWQGPPPVARSGRRAGLRPGEAERQAARRAVETALRPRRDPRLDRGPERA